MAKDAPDEFATALLPPAGPRPAEPDQALDTNNNQPEEISAAPPVDSRAAADRHEPKADTSAPEPARETPPSLGSPALQPNLIEDADAAHCQFRIEPQEALPGAGHNDNRRGEIADLLDTLRNSLDKIEQHGKRADAIVAEALMNIRPSVGQPSVTILERAA